MEIISIEEQEGKPKRFKVITLEWGKKRMYQFGQPNGFTYIDGASIQTRRNYLLRHMANETEAHLINNNIPSPALFSAKLLWGNSNDLIENINDLNEIFKSY
jgi:hypothetical protein